MRYYCNSNPESHQKTLVEANKLARGRRITKVKKHRWSIKTSQIDWELYDEYGITMKEELATAA